MAEIFPDEGLDYLLNIAVGGGTPDTTLFLGLFTSQTPSTVPARTATGGAAPSGWTEMAASSGTYARQAVATSDWGAPATNGNGRRRTLSAPEVFSGFIGAAAANGFFLATNPQSEAGDTILYFANFDSLTARTFAALLDELNLTARIQFDG